MFLKNQKGQGLIEYLILVAILAIASIGIVRLLGQTVTAQFATITNTLQGDRNQVKAPMERVEERHYKKKDLGDFFQGATSRD